MTTTQIFLVLICVVGLSIGQLFFKLSAGALEGHASIAAFFQLLQTPWFILALLTYGGATVIWIGILKNVPLSYAYPFFACSFILVPLLGWLVLGESITTSYWIGIALISAGVVVTTL